MSDDMRSELNNNLLALNLGIGDAIQLQDVSETSRASNQRYFAKLIGFLNKAGIIVTHPHKDGTWLPLADGKSLLVRGFSGRKTYEFEAQVISANTMPYPHLHLSFPKKIECLTMRAALRIHPKSLSGWIEQEQVHTDTGVIKVPMLIVDLSTSGARVHARRKFGGIGDQVNIMLHLPLDEEDHVFAVTAVIRKSYVDMLPEVTNGGEVTTYGLEFIQPEGDVRMALQSYIYKTMAEG